MDPTTTYWELVDCLQQKKYRRAAELQDALRLWLEKGGFPPACMTTPNVLEYLKDVRTMLARRHIT